MHAVPPLRSMPSMVVSPQLLFNIGLPVCSTTSHRVDYISAVNQDSIPTADEVCLAPVYRHDGFEHPLPEWLFKIVRSHMEDYFNLRGKGRLLYHGDVIGITLDARRWAGRTARLASGEINNSLRLYFKVRLGPKARCTVSTKFEIFKTPSSCRFCSHPVRPASTR